MEQPTEGLPLLAFTLCDFACHRMRLLLNFGLTLGCSQRAEWRAGTEQGGMLRPAAWGDVEGTGARKLKLL